MGQHQVVVTFDDRPTVNDLKQKIAEELKVPAPCLRLSMVDPASEEEEPQRTFLSDDSALLQRRHVVGSTVHVDIAMSKKAAAAGAADAGAGVAAGSAAGGSGAAGASLLFQALEVAEKADQAEAGGRSGRRA